ncbi:MFS transporter [Deinococcus rubellus]|uniref:MFS transporter n=1 Tax=Deinococcus rubellus TaxID=1889240 RepID=A0ABY5YDG1_9DEIO|nr:MFS transporter [Deinococcus rubellus]UWX62875.1 MFS transporter [Deinococcus rubellus]
MSSTFRSLKIHNYRVWASGAIISNIGTWMQRTAQDWLVLTQLTHHNATALGVVTALQFGPQLLLLPLTGLAADTLDRRRLLMATQMGQGVLALLLGLLTVLGHVQLWQVYGFAALLGIVTAFDAPVRQTFVSELVSEADLPNAVGLNSTSFNAARMVGPAVAGVLIGAVGTGWVFLINAASFAAVIVSLSRLRLSELRRDERAARKSGNLLEGFAYVRQRPDLRVILLMLFFVGTFAINFPIFISTMSVSVFHAGAGEYGLLNSVMAVGAVAGALLAARRDTVPFGVLLSGAAVLGVGLALAAVMPSIWLFGLTLVVVGISAQTFMNSSNTIMQLSTEPAMRGRVMALRLAVALGAMPIGAPLLGWVADTFGPRWSMGMGAMSGLAALLVGVFYLVRYRHLRVWLEAGRLKLNMDRELSL